MSLYTTNILCALIIGFMIQCSHSAEQYIPVGPKAWDGPYKFTTQVQKRNTRESMGRFEFKANNTPCDFRLLTNQSFPPLDLTNQASCQTFYDRLKQYVAQCQITDRQYKYIGHLPDKKKKHSLRPPGQNPLPCSLETLDFLVNRNMGLLSLSDIVVKIGSDEDHCFLSIKHKITDWSDGPIPFAVLQNAEDSTIICKNQDGQVFLAKGETRHYHVPAIPGTSLKEAHDFISSNYCSTTTTYKNAVYASVFPKNQEAYQGDVLESCSDSTSVDEYSDTSSMTNSRYEEYSHEESKCLNFLDSYEFYKVEGESLEITNNPFMLLESDGRGYYLQAFHVPCFPIIHGNIDQNTPYILQSFHKAKITGGRHYCHNIGFGLQRIIYDEHNLPLFPNSFESQGISVRYLNENITMLRQEPVGNNKASYNQTYILPGSFYPNCHKYWQEFKENCNTFKSVFDPYGKEVIWTISQNSHRHFDLVTISEIIKGSSIEKLEITGDYTDLSKHDNRDCPLLFRESILSLSHLTTLKIKMDNRVVGLLGGWGANCYLPRTLEHLDITSIPYDPGLYNIAYALQTIKPKLKTLSLSAAKDIESGSGNMFFQIFNYFGGFVKSNPQLEELHLDFQIDNHAALQSPGIKEVAPERLFPKSTGPGSNRGINGEEPGGCFYVSGYGILTHLEYILAGEPDSKWEEKYCHIRDNFGPALLNSNLKVFSYCLNTPPKGATIVYNRNPQKFIITAAQPAIGWKHLLTLIEQLKRKPELKVIIK